MRVFISLSALLLPLVLFGQIHPPEEQTPIDINKQAIKKDPAPPVLAFNNYGGSDLKIENTYGATEAGLLLAQEWATLKATPCTDSSLAVCAGYAKALPSGPSVTVKDGGTTRTYTLQQFHFHIPAEHTINGRRPAMEIHFVHLYNNGCTPAPGDMRPGLVVGAFIEEGRPTPALEKFFSSLTAIPHDNTKPAVTEFANLRDLLPQGTYEWRYDGGLTAPAGAGLCGPGVLPSVTNQLITGDFPEVVHWFLYDRPLYLSHEEIERFAEVFPEGNSRPLKENKNPVYENASGGNGWWR